MRITIGRKLSIGFIIILIVMIVMGVSSYISLNKIKRSTDTIAQYAQEMKEVSKLRFPLIEALIVNDYLVSGEVGKKGHFEEVSRVVGEVMHDAKSFPFSEEEKKLLMEIDKYFGVVKNKSHEILKFADFTKKEFTDLRSNKVIEEIDTAAAIVVDNIEGLDELVRRNLIQEIKRSERIKLSGNVTIIITSFTAVVVGIIAWFILTRSITTPIHSLISTTKIMARGDLIQRADVRSSDEIGDLANSFNNMAENLQKTTVSRDYVENIVKTIADALIIVDLDGKIRTINPVTVKLLGYKEDELIGLPVSTIFAQEELQFKRKGIADLVEKDSFNNVEKSFLAKDGTEIPVLFSAKVMRYNEGKIREIVCVALDITERKQAEERFISYQEQLQSLASELSLTEERERRRIASDLHDSIGQALIVTKMKLEELREMKISAAVDRLLDDIYKLLEKTIQDTRSLTFELSPPVLYELGFEPAVEWLIEQIQEQHGIVIDFMSDGRFKPLNDDIRVLLFKAIRELLVNVVKHADAQNVKIFIKRDGNNIWIEVEDDGIGSDTAEFNFSVSRSGGFGLFNMRERLEHLGGHFEVKSEPGHGTQVTLVAPLKCKEETIT
ncbi:MAG: diguanylate cyclase/phosphodiesterase with PAS/PAC sensor [Candidatus Scalindua rubra]|uniref:histidine kinase n=1 Tax=Candidatus Scalindua rubra TaxID=1872076 RepID=A0A1E3XGN9_9BACT|nr:MAG: diguanylate cyclase/phosphodiesterase with PAS/PAC sensor [Candidatus Scalindua rubra]